MTPFHKKQLERLPLRLVGIGYEAIVAIEARGKVISHLRAYCQSIADREDRSCAFVSLDDDRGDDFSSAEQLAAADPCEIVSFRLAVLDLQTEASLACLSHGAAALGQSLGLTGRRGQQIVRQQIERARSETDFREGRQGQGGLFGFDGEVA